MKHLSDSALLARIKDLPTPRAKPEKTRAPEATKKVGRAIPVEIKRQVLARDGHCCVRCGSAFQLETPTYAQDRSSSNEYKPV